MYPSRFAPLIWISTQKKAWHYFAFIGCSEVFDYLPFPITTSKAHAFWRERRCFFLEMVLKVSKFQNNQIKLLRFFLFYDVHIA